MAKTLRRGDVALLALAVFTAVEFVAAVNMHGALLLAALSSIGVIKAALILNWFMHFGQLGTHIVKVWNSFWLDTSGTEDDE